MPNLRCFELRCRLETSFYDEVFIPLLHRMFNLESLSLYFVLINRKKFLDGYELKENIINHLPRSNEFVFNICSMISTDNQIGTVEKGRKEKYRKGKMSKIKISKTKIIEM